MRESRDWDLEYDGAVPPLPRRQFRSGRYARALRERLRQGAYYLWIEPFFSETAVPAEGVLAGVLRVVHEGGSAGYGRLVISASGDLYKHSKDEAIALAKQVRKPSAENLSKLQFSLSEHLYYLRADNIWVTGELQFVLGFETFRSETIQRRWEPRQRITAKIPNEPSEDGSFVSKLFNSYGTHIGKMHLLFASPYLRRAEVVVHETRDSSVTWTEGEWQRALASAGWHVALRNRREIGEVPDGGVWTEQALRSYRENNLEVREDAYHLMIVRHVAPSGGSSHPIDDQDGKPDEGPAGEGPAGKMFDTGSAEDPGRRVAVVAFGRNREWPPSKPERKAAWEFPDLLLRTALHEVGHMQGLYHNPAERGIMQPVRDLREDLKEDRSERPLENNRNEPWKYKTGEFDPRLDLRHSPSDRFRLQHLPDWLVRPGGVPFSHRYRASAFEVRDLVESDSVVLLSVDPVEATLGDPPGGLTLRLCVNKGEKKCPLVLPWETTESWPESGRFGLRLTTPSGNRAEVFRLAFPANLRALTDVRVGDQPLAYSVPWKNSGEYLREVGIYRLDVDLVWIDRSGTDREDVLRATGYGSLTVNPAAS